MACDRRISTDESSRWSGSQRARSARSRRRSTPTCWTPTTTSRRSWTSACASAAAAGGHGPGARRRARRVRPRRRGSEASGHGPGLLILDGLVAVQHADRRPHRDRAAGRRRPAAAAVPERRRHDRARDAAGGRSNRAGSRCSTRSSPSACCPGRRSRTRCCAARSAAPDDLGCDACDLVPAAAGGAPGAAALAPGRALGHGSRRPAFASALPLTHRLLGQLVAAERPSISHALARLARAPGWSPAAPATGTSTAGSTSTSSR